MVTAGATPNTTEGNSPASGSYSGEYWFVGDSQGGVRQEGGSRRGWGAVPVENTPSTRVMNMNRDKAAVLTS